MHHLAALTLLACLLTFACRSTSSMMNKTDQELYVKAVELAHKFIITDGHIDLPYRLTIKNFRFEKEVYAIPVQSDEGDFDYVRAKEGGLDAPFMAVFIPASYQDDPPGAQSLADSLIRLVEGIIETNPDKFGKGDTPRMIESNFAKGIISLPMGLENGAPIITLKDVAYYYQRGIRYVTLTHAKDNHICDSSYDTARTWGGLSPFGIKLIEEMNRIGMIIDVSHISDETFYQVMNLSEAPVLATHSSCRAFTPEWERNMSDDMIKLLAQKDGVIQINFGTTFLDAEIAKNRQLYQRELDAALAEAGYKANDPEAKPILDSFRQKYPVLYSDVKRVADHIDHVRKLVGIDHIGLGSDFDGVGDSLPTGLKDVSMYPNLIHELLRRNYSEKDIEKICYKNVWRVWKKVNQVASAS